MVLPLGVPRAIIADETYPLRFEKFAAHLVSKLEGGTHVVITSSNYDRGRDGVSAGAGAAVVICCSLTDQIETKVSQDAKKICKTTKGFDTLYFCSSQKLTEAESDKLAAQFTRIISPSTATVTVLGREKLAFFASQHEDVLRAHYPAEVQGAIQALAEGADTNEFEHSLRLALSYPFSQPRRDVGRRRVAGSRAWKSQSGSGRGWSGRNGPNESRGGVTAA